jgi:hypothetical protein
MLSIVLKLYCSYYIPKVNADSWNVAQVVNHLPNKHKVLSSIPCTTN